MAGHKLPLRRGEIPSSIDAMTSRRPYLRIEVAVRMKKLTVRLDDDFSKRLRIYSIQTGEPLQQMIVRLLREELARARKGRKQ